MFQSTHSLRSATICRARQGFAFKFQSTHSLRSATQNRTITCMSSRFQSTHSLRSATSHPYSDACQRVFQSTHSLRSATSNSYHCSRDMISFNPRTPCGVRQEPEQLSGRLTRFQSTHSLRSATEINPFELPKSEVSIHALLAECDNSERNCKRVLTGFNPRTPCGVRQRLTIYIVIQQRKRYFAPTSRRRPSSSSLLF